MKRSISFVATTARSSLGTGGLSPASRPWRSLGVTPRTYDRIMQKIAEAAGALIEALTQALAGFDPGCLSGRRRWSWSKSWLGVRRCVRRCGPGAAARASDLLAEHTVEAMLARLSTRRYPAALEPVGKEVDEQASARRSPAWLVMLSAVPSTSPCPGRTGHEPTHTHAGRALKMTEALMPVRVAAAGRSGGAPRWRRQKTPRTSGGPRPCRRRRSRLPPRR